MSRNRRSNKQNGFVQIFKEMLQSKAWEELSNPARVAYIHMKAKVYKKNQDDITLSYEEMIPFMQKNTFASAIRQLEKFGFIRITQKGGLYRTRNYYRFLENWREIK